MIDKAFVKKSFNACAATYDDFADLQRRLGAELVRFAGIDGAGKCSRVLDLGTGTGNLSAQTLEVRPRARVFGCDIALSMLLQAHAKQAGCLKGPLLAAADAEALPYRESSFDLVISSFTLQWINQWDRVLAEIRRVLSPGWLCAFSAFGSKTFSELRGAYRRACDAFGYAQGAALELALSEERIQTAFTSGGFLDHCTVSYTRVAIYPDVPALVRAIKGMGARNASDRRNRTPGVRKVWKSMVELYERDYGQDGGIQATFEIVMGRGKKPER